MSVLVVLTLTGFSTGRGGHGGGHGGDGDGGGCSSSGQDHDSSSSSSSGGGSYKDDDHGADYDYHYGGGNTSGGSDGGSSGGSGSGTSRSPLRDAEAELVSCATAARPYALVEVTNPNARGGTFRVRVDFTDDETHSALDNASKDVTVRAGETQTARIPFTGSVTALDHCEVVPEATPVP